MTLLCLLREILIGSERESSESGGSLVAKAFLRLTIKRDNLSGITLRARHCLARTGCNSAPTKKSRATMRGAGVSRIPGHFLGQTLADGLHVISHFFYSLISINLLPRRG